MDIKNLFGIKPQTNASTIQDDNQQQAGETYQDWGHRMAGKNNGNVASLDTHLQIAYHSIRKKQEKDAELQKKLQDEIQQNIARNQKNLEYEENVLQTTKEKINRLKESLDSIYDQINSLKGQVKRKNSEAKANFIIGLCIIIPLTIYLFIFYSSTAYAAFFKEIDYTQALGSHMFDPQALSDAWQQSWTAGLFVILITFIFMALGFILHQFTRQEGNSKYLKVGSIVVVTFVFDTLLAYLIAKNMYDAEALTKLGDVEPYTLSMAFTDARFWIVIFCGFLAYIIWGLLFGFVMDSYNKLDLNKVEMEGLRKQTERLNQQKQDAENALTSQNAKIAQLKSDIAAQQTRITNAAMYDYTTIKLELNNFFSGWQIYMNNASKSPAEIAQANSIFDNFTSKLPVKA